MCWVNILPRRRQKSSQKKLLQADYLCMSIKLWLYYLNTCNLSRVRTLFWSIDLEKEEILWCNQKPKKKVKIWKHSIKPFFAKILIVRNKSQWRGHQLVNWWTIITAVCQKGRGRRWANKKKDPWTFISILKGWKI